MGKTKGPQVAGFMVGGGFTGSASEAGLAPGVQYWTTYLGGRLRVPFSIDMGNVKSGNVEGKLRELGYGVQADALFGMPMKLGTRVNRFKPHLSLGLGYIAESKKGSALGFVVEEKTSAAALILGAGLDILAAKNLAVGIEILDAEILLSGTIEDEDGKQKVKGFGLDLLSGLNVWYIF